MAIDIDQSHYSTGTATVSGVNVTGFGTTFTVLRKGDQWGTHKGFGVRIAGITDDTHLTLAYDVPGLQQTAAPFEVQRTPYDIGYLQAIDELIRLLGEGALPSLAGVDGTGGDKLIKLIGPNTAEAFDGKRVINIAALTGAGVIEFDVLGNAALVPKGDLIAGIDTDGKANTLAERNSKYGTQAAGFSVFVANIGDGRSAVYFKNTATLNDWSVAALLTGPIGPTPTITVGTTTTVPPGQPATVNPVAIPGGVRLDFEIPRGPTGDINGVTPFWNTRLGADTTAAQARAGLGLETPIFVNTGSVRNINRAWDYYVGGTVTDLPVGFTEGYLRVSHFTDLPGWKTLEFVGVDSTVRWQQSQRNGVWGAWQSTRDAALLTGLLDAARVPETLSPAQAFRRGNIIGTVSQTAGVPTGALSSGWVSNANGYYRRSADGTQTCLIQKIVYLDNALYQSSTLPATFVDANYSVACSFASAATVGSTGTWNIWKPFIVVDNLASSSVGFLYSNTPQGIAGVVYCEITGRWF